MLNCAAPGTSTFMSVSPDLAQLEQNNIKYLGLQLCDDPDQEIAGTFTQAGEWIEEALATDGGR